MRNGLSARIPYALSAPTAPSCDLSRARHITTTGACRSDEIQSSQMIYSSLHDLLVADSAPQLTSRELESGRPARDQPARLFWLRCRSARRSREHTGRCVPAMARPHIWASGRLTAASLCIMAGPVGQLPVAPERIYRASQQVESARWGWYQRRPRHLRHCTGQVKSSCRSQAGAESVMQGHIRRTVCAPADGLTSRPLALRFSQQPTTDGKLPCDWEGTYALARAARVGGAHGRACWRRRCPATGRWSRWAKTAIVLP